MTESRGASPRRRFIANLVGGTAAIAAGAALPGELAGQGMPTYPPPQGGWDVSWADRVAAAKHRAVFDCAGVDDGLALTNAATYMAGWKDVYNTADSDLGVVVVIRHKAIQMALNDAIWARWNIGEQLGVKDGGEPAKRNTFAGRAEGGRGGGGTITGLIGRGATVLCCNLALMRSAGQFATAMQMPVEEARTLFIDSLVPGIIRQTNGIFAVTRAQEAGAVLVKST
ncbi:MAG TPA: hypothetical protein VG916_10340 [Gemmatimonadaceae bacterium]|nr:hypothetical protein [Gemmatimonadaceae bacterium]